MPVAITLHVLAAVIWVGGMFFAYVALRPVAATLLEPPLRMQLWVRTFARFFPWVWAAVIVLPATGYWAVAARLGGFAHLPLYVNVMQGIGVLMILIYLHVFFAPYQRLKRCVGLSDFAAAARHLAQIRRLIGLNMTLGLITVAVAVAGALGGVGGLLG